MYRKRVALYVCAVRDLGKQLYVALIRAERIAVMILFSARVFDDEVMGIAYYSAVRVFRAYLNVLIVKLGVLFVVRARLYHGHGLKRFALGIYVGIRADYELIEVSRSVCVVAAFILSDTFESYFVKALDNVRLSDIDFRPQEPSAHTARYFFAAYYKLFIDFELLFGVSVAYRNLEHLIERRIAHYVRAVVIGACHNENNVRRLILHIGIDIEFKLGRRFVSGSGRDVFDTFFAVAGRLSRVSFGKYHIARVGRTFRPFGKISFRFHGDPVGNGDRKRRGRFAAVLYRQSYFSDRIERHAVGINLARTVFYGITRNGSGSSAVISRRHDKPAEI